MSVFPFGCRLVLFALIALFVAVPGARAETITIDFSEPGPGPFDPNYFASRGVIFQPGLDVTFGQGDEALVSTGFGSSGPFAHSISGSFDPEITSISIRVALAAQYVSDLQLATFDEDTNLISRTIIQLNTIITDPGFMGFGYVPVDLGPIPQPASSFLILNQFVRAPHLIGSEFLVSEITITPVPEPSGIGLLAFGLAMAAGVLHREWK
jgi:hypothetical protein